MESCSDRLSPSSDLSNESETSLPTFPYEQQSNNFYLQTDTEKQYYSCQKKSPRNEDRKETYLQENKNTFECYLSPSKNKKYVNFEIKLPPINDNFFSQNMEGDDRALRPAFMNEQKGCTQDLAEIDVNQFENIAMTNYERDRQQAYFAENEASNMRRYLNFNSEQVQCLCEALQQKGDIEKLSDFLRSLPTSEVLRGNETVLR